MLWRAPLKIKIEQQGYFGATDTSRKGQDCRNDNYIQTERVMMGDDVVTTRPIQTRLQSISKPVSKN
jgi:hypothetical protein